jgi:putative ATP-dependent endonuclease of OLD family
MDDPHITKIYCHNFRAFKDRTVDGLTPGLNVFVGDNDTGKSTILLALDLVLRASISRVQSFGLERLMNSGAVAAFLDKKDRSYADLPIMEVDLHLSDMQKHEYEGKFYANAKEEACGISLICRPRDELKDAISDLVKDENCTFPFEYYSIEFKTFSGLPLTAYKRPLEHLTIDNTKISNDYASMAYIRDVYKANTDDTERSLHQIKYRQAKADFAQSQFDELNKKISPEHAFSIKSNNKANLETDLTIKQNDIEIDNLGMGMQCFIRTSFALSKKSSIDVVLLEEPENHLSHLNMKRLINQISQETKSQVFIATHSSYICSRLDLRKAILFGQPDEKPVRLNEVPDDTAEFFMKAPHNSLLEFIQSHRSILVEGDAEYILLSPFYENVTGANIEEGAVSVISVGGTSFPRYLDVAKLLGNRVAVVTDNDGDPESARLKRYLEYASADHIGVFFDDDKDRRTFEICVYKDNTDLCEKLFAPGRRTLSVQEYMIENKSESAFKLASLEPDKLTPPKYIKEAILWAGS